MVTGTIIMPTTHEQSDIVIQAAKQELAREYGGFSAYTGQGGWVNDEGELIEESHVRLEVVAENGGDLWATLATIAEEFKRRCDEDAVLVTIQDSEKYLL